MNDVLTIVLGGGRGTRLFFRGVLFWIVVVGPFVLGLVLAIGNVDWDALAETGRRGGDDLMSRIEGVAPALAVAALSFAWSLIAIALLYPAFQAMVLRWWLSGLRFGALTVTSRLSTRAVYRLYGRFAWQALLAAVVLGIVAFIGVAIIGVLETWLGKGTLTELLQTAILIGTYVVVALAYSTIYQATVKLRLWQQGFQSIELAGTEVLEGVKAAGASGSAVGEGLADALNVGGI